MASKKQIELEIKLIKLGFKRKWLDDKSGYWFFKKVRYNDLKLKFICEPDNKLCLLEAMTYTEIQPYKEKQYEIVKIIKCNYKDIEKYINKYK